MAGTKQTKKNHQKIAIWKPEHSANKNIFNYSQTRVARFFRPNLPDTNLF